MAPAECGEAGRAAQARRGAGEEDGAAAARHHHLGDLAAHQEAGERTHLPHLAVHALGGLGDAEAHVGADVEDGDFDRPDVALDRRDQLGHLGLVACIGTEAARLAAVGLDAIDQRLQLVGRAPRDAGDEAFARETARDRAAGGVTGADHERGATRRIHQRYIPSQSAGTAALMPSGVGTGRLSANTASGDTAAYSMYPMRAIGRISPVHTLPSRMKASSM